MAAGIQLDLACLAAVQLTLRRELAARVSPDQQARALAVEILLDWTLLASQGRDGVAELDEVYRQLQLLQPFGHGNPNPVVALMNVRRGSVRLRASQNGRHLKFELGSRALWFWEAGEELERWQACQALDIALQLEAEQPWQGKVLAVRPSGDWQAPTVSAPSLRIQDYRQRPLPDSLQEVFRYDGQALPLEQDFLPSAKTALLLARWPWLPANLAQLLQQVQPQTLILAASGHHWKRLPHQIARLQELGRTGQWDPHVLAATTGLPWQWLAELEGPEQIPTRLLGRIQESQAFHRWLDEASPTQIAQLCQRLLRPDPLPAVVSPK